MMCVGTLVLHEIASAAPQIVRNTPSYCHRRIRTVWAAPIHCEDQTVPLFAAVPTFRNEESCEVHSLEMILAILIDTNIPNTAAASRDSRRRSTRCAGPVRGRHSKLFVGHIVRNFGRNTETRMTARCFSNIL